jgi:hypothetical protein
MLHKDKGSGQGTLHDRPEARLLPAGGASRSALSGGQSGHHHLGWVGEDALLLVSDGGWIGLGRCLPFALDSSLRSFSDGLAVVRAIVVYLSAQLGFALDRGGAPVACHVSRGDLVSNLDSSCCCRHPPPPAPSSLTVTVHPNNLKS